MIEMETVFEQTTLDQRIHFLQKYFSWNDWNKYFGGTDYSHPSYTAMVRMGEDLIPMALQLMSITRSTSLVPAVLTVLNNRVITPGATPEQRRDELISWGVLNRII